MKKTISAFITVAFLFSGVQSANSVATTSKVYQKTLTTFSSNTTSLSAAQKMQVKTAVDANLDADKFICTGIRYVSDPASVNIQVRARAKAACAYAKELNPNLSTWYQNKPSSARSYAGKVLLTVKSPEAPAYADTFAEQVLNKAIEEVAKRSAKAQTFSGEINVFVSSSFLQKSVDLTIEATKQGVSYLGDLYEFTGADFVFFSKADVVWAQQKWDEIVAGSNLQGLKVYDPTSPFPCKSAEYTYKINGVTKYIKYVCDDGNQGGDVSFGAHGTIHWFQGLYNVHTMPNWLVEGSAALYGTVIGYGANNPKAKVVIWAGDYKLHDALKAGPESIREEIAKVEVKNPSSAIYPTGQMLYTALIGLYGEDKAIEFMKSFGNSSDEKANFLKIYGFTLEEFYQESIPLIAEWAVRDWK